MYKIIFYIFPLLLFIGCSNDENIYLPDSSYHYINPHKNNSSKYKKRVIQKPYFVLGHWYYPIRVKVGDTFRGIASWYGPDFHGKLTANGEIYNMYDYTAANKILPLGTIVKVINLKNHKSVKVRINDRGPFVKGRIIDLSYIAGKRIGIDKTGTTPVKLIVLSTPLIKNNFYKKKKKYGKIVIQVGAFSSYKSALRAKRKYKKSYITKENNLYKVYIGNFKNYKEAQKFKEIANIEGFVKKRK